jgi:hypothetical protein
MQFKARFQNNWLNQLTSLGAIVGFLVAIWYVVSSYIQSDFFSFFPIYTIAFGLYIYLVFWAKTSFKILVGLGIAFRLVILFYFPNLSDDIYRFYWDGILALNGINPYGLLPSDAVNLGLDGLNQSIFEQLNSPEYYTIYPPISQLYFIIGSVFKDVFWFGVVLKSLFVLTEILGLWFIAKLLESAKMDSKKALIYFLNPLILIEGVGNLHFEVVMISFFCASIYFLFKKRIVISAILMSVSIGIKLLPLMILPYLWFRMDVRNRFKYFLVISLTCLIIFIPVFGGVELLSFMESIDLYFQKFEFNASVYYVMRYFGQMLSGYNLIKYLGPMLALFVLGYNVKKAMNERSFDLPSFVNYGLVVWTVYLLCATTVHPWYVAMLVFFSVFTQSKYALAWSYLIFISYVNYSYQPYYENMVWISLEYGLLICFIGYEQYLMNKAHSENDHSKHLSNNLP